MPDIAAFLRLQGGRSVVLGLLGSIKFRPGMVVYLAINQNFWSLESILRKTENGIRNACISNQTHLHLIRQRDVPIEPIILLGDLDRLVVHHQWYWDPFVFTLASGSSGCNVGHFSDTCERLPEKKVKYYWRQEKRVRLRGLWQSLPEGKAFFVWEFDRWNVRRRKKTKKGGKRKEEIAKKKEKNRGKWGFWENIVERRAPYLGIL